MSLVTKQEPTCSDYWKSSLPSDVGGLFICIPITLHSRRFRYAIKQKEHPMQQFAIAGAASVRPFNPILSVQHSRKNILTGADFKQPRMKSLLEKLWDILKQQGRP
nr:MAG TPA: Lambda Phage CIII [Caudoviricetes sp.]DAY59685.1 MAG TPA: Lambda Phage CIII [Caudoviricetes sp.]